MHSEYRNPILKQLRDQQVRYAPREKKLEQAARKPKDRDADELWDGDSREGGGVKGSNRLFFEEEVAQFAR